MRVPFTDKGGNVIEILDSRDLTDEEWELVKKNRSGVLSMNDIIKARENA